MVFDDVLSVDEEISSRGVWKHVKLGDKTVMSGLVRYVDVMTQAGDLEYKRARSAYNRIAGTDQDPTTTEAVLIALAFVNLADWKGVKSKGKDVPFSAEVAFDFFKNEKTHWIAFELARFDNEPANFVRNDVEFNVEEISKN